MLKMEQPGAMREGDWGTKQQPNIMDYIAVKTAAQANGSQPSLHSFSMTREEQERYLLSLLSFGLERVAAEPERIAHEIRSVPFQSDLHRFAAASTAVGK